jgi:UDP-N-acetylglucosamine--N-acetylmuramyl-(pentapeptide) pyrophosphoryl-undecaprenol N-acetylglucosamine transferase
MKRIVLTGGGSGGHIMPLYAVAEQISKKAQTRTLDVELHYLGPKDQHSEILRELGIELHAISSSKIRRYAAGFLGNLLDIPRFFLGFAQALLKLLWIMPDAIFSKGGPGAFAVVLAGWIYRIPVVIHESDSVPGLTNALSSRFARRIAASFEKASKSFDPSKVLLSGQPIRRDLLEYRPSQKDAKKTLGFSEEMPLLLVIGGSQGSRRINEFLITLLPQILPDTQVLHQTGTANYDEIKKLTRVELMEMPVLKEAKSRYEAVPFIRDMKTALSAADVIVSRASSTVFEFASFGKPSILIPLYESANDHQRANAYEYARTGAAIVIEEPNLLPAIFVNQLREILRKPDLREKMGQAAQAFFRPGAADLLAEEVLSLLT